MVYSKKIVAVIKVNGKILREVNNENEVILPFGAEYSILLKNLDSRRAVIEVSIDGSDVLNGHRLVVDANDDVELKGVMVDNAVKNVFKFIQKSKKIQDHRGDKIDDGFIRIKFGFEKYMKPYYVEYYPPIRKSIIDYNRTPVYGTTYISNGSSSLRSETPRSVFSNTVCCDSIDSFQPQQDEGITVPGSETTQEFNTTTVGTIEDHGSIVIKLKGTDFKMNFVSKPLTVKTKIKCPTCGTKSKSGTKFCGECGTNIQV